ncbi:MAG TPA: DmsE family decaheme c-type cytochrome [Thermoanaerobaculia bacterium]|nr:DmsE family decaheme c-type cytochrome [Thermoanaerobaculia bacterium]
MRRGSLQVLILAGGVLLAFSPLSSHRPAAGGPVAAQGETAPAAEPEVAAAHVAAPGATYVGSETCLGCHDTLDATLARTPHGSRHFLEIGVHGCETCHGPGSVHVEDPDVEAHQPSLERLSAQQQTAVCRSCHDGREQFFWEGSKHARRDLSCLTCHSIHSAQSNDGQLRLASDVEQCATCHKDVRAETWKSSHHPIREGKITCADCHNPHGGPAEKMVRADSVNDLCYSCHTEKRGPFLWEHAPVRESCLTCHTPHGSNHAKLQRVAVPYLCQQCHANTRHPSTLYDARNLPTEGPTASNRLVERGCVNCHSAVHGSNHPSSPYLAH